MASSVSRPRAKGLVTARGTAARRARPATSAPRSSRKRFQLPFISSSYLADRRLAEDAGGAEGEGEDKQCEAGRLAPAAAQVEAGQALQGAEEDADQDHAEARVEAGDEGEREGRVA